MKTVSLFVAVMMFASCSNSPTTESPFVLVEPSGRARTVELHDAQQLIFRLPANPSAGQHWDVVNGSDAFSTIGSSRFEPVGEGTPGGTGFIWMNFRPKNGGESTIRLGLFSFDEQLALETVDVTVLANAPVSIDDEKPHGFSTEEWLAEHSKKPGVRQDELCSYSASKVNLCANGACTPIKNQGSCGSCWDFAAVGVLENTIRQTDWVVRDLSEQQILSCDSQKPYCSGSTYFGDGLDPLKLGAVYELDFPYSASAYILPDGGTGSQTACPGALARHERIDNWSQTTWVSSACVKQRLEAGQFVMTFADASAWWNNTTKYNGGVRIGSNPAIATHVVMIVGYDDIQGVWILRNSWGTNWGETADGAPRDFSNSNGGYMRLAYGGDAVATDIAYVSYTPNPAVKASLIIASMNN